MTRKASIKSHLNVSILGLVADQLCRKLAVSLETIVGPFNLIEPVRFDYVEYYFCLVFGLLPSRIAALFIFGLVSSRRAAISAVCVFSFSARYQAE